MANKIIKGRDLMLFDSAGKSFAFATNHTLTITAETTDISSKDHGIWGATEVSKYTWEIQSENLFTEKAYGDIFDTMMQGDAIEVRFGLKTTPAPADDTPADSSKLTNWTAGSTYYTGKALITSLTANANNGDNATFSVTLTGVNQIKRVGTIESHSLDGGKAVK